MKLTAEQVEKIEGLITFAQEYGYRAAIIKYDIRDIHVLSNMMTSFRAAGVDVHVSNGPKSFPLAMRAEFAEWLRTRKVAPHA